MNTSLAEELATYFLVKNYEWKFDYGLVNPDENDIQAALNKAEQLLNAESAENAQLEVGRLIFKKREGVIDVFVMAGTLGEDNE